MNSYFKKSKNIASVILCALLIDIIIIVFVSIYNAGNILTALYIALPILLVVILSPISLFYLIKSYAMDVENETQRTVYAIALGILNFTILVLLVSIAFGKIF